jgi:hypothetical protein
MKTTLFIGDTVLWRGGFGNDPGRPAKVTSIERVSPGENYGDSVTSLPWSQVPTCAVVDLDNGHWARGSQLSPF